MEGVHQMERGKAAARCKRSSKTKKAHVNDASAVHVARDRSTAHQTNRILGTCQGVWK